MARGFLDYLPQSVLDATSTNDFTSTVQTAMGGIKEMGAQLMQPVGQQLASLMPEPAPMPMPQPEPPRIAPFSLGSMEDWGFGSTAQPAQKQQEVTPQRGMFSLPDMSSWIPAPGSAQEPVRQASSGTPSAAPAAAASRQAGSVADGPLGDIEEGKPDRYFATAGPYARQVEKETGIPAALSLAISANETGYGQRRYMAGSNNYHGIQARAGEPGAVPYKDWRPGPGGQQEFYDAAQRSFASPLDGFRGFAQFLLENPRYAPALEQYKKTGDVNQLAAGIHKAGYAEDPAYTQKITSIMKGIPVATGVGEVTDTRGVPLTSGGAPPTQQRAQPTASQAPAASGGLDVGGITQAYKGVQYTFGGPGGRGQGLGATTDCSGFVAAVWKDKFGIDLPAHTDASYNQLQKLGAAEVAQKDARAGDIVYYMGAGTGGAITHHMGIYAGDGKVLDMSTSGGSGVRTRDVGHGGKFVILRDPRINPEQPQSAAQPQPIVPTGVAERSGGQKMPQAQVEALSNAPWDRMQRMSYNDPTAGGTISEPPSGGARAAPSLHANVARAFERANNRPPTPEEAAELAGLGFA